MTSTPACLRCQTPMEDGFLVDHARNSLRVTLWCAGKPEKSFWAGEMSSAQYKTAMCVSTFRCPDCGYLESYASTQE